jgi:exopolyphosphatase/guanosine-5'-triphosphate,3'-diphosphate pyrophosphatase
VVYDMLHRSDAPADDDPRMVTVSRMQHRYGVDTEQARRVAALAQSFWQRIDPAGPDALLSWAAAVHEIGMAIAHEDYHQHSAYIIEHSDIYGFAEQERPRSRCWCSVTPVRSRKLTARRCRPNC